MNTMSKPFPLGTGQLSENKPAIQLNLWFASQPRFELLKTTFRSPSIPSEVHSVRGKTAGAYVNSTTFQWTAAVQALSVLLLRAAADGRRAVKSVHVMLEGGQNSLASSLDGALQKQVGWLDLFGSNAHGESLSKRILIRTNTGMRRPGPVSVSLNEHVLPRGAITVHVDNQRIHDPAVVERWADSLEAVWNSGHSVMATFPSMHLSNPLKI